MGGSSASPADVLGKTRKTQQAIRWQQTQDTLLKVRYLTSRWTEWPPDKLNQLAWLSDMARTVGRITDAEIVAMLTPALYELRLEVERRHRKDDSPEKRSALQTMVGLQLRSAWHRARVQASALGIGDARPPLRCLGCGAEGWEAFDLLDTYDPHPRAANPRTRLVCRRCQRPLEGVWWEGRRRDLTAEVRRQMAWTHPTTMRPEAPTPSLPPPTVPRGTTSAQRLDFLTDLEMFLTDRHDVPTILAEINRWLGRVAAADAELVNTWLIPMGPLISAIGSHSRTPAIWRPAVRKLERTLHALAFQARWEATPPERRHPACPACGHTHTYLSRSKPTLQWTCRRCGQVYDH